MLLASIAGYRKGRRIQTWPQTTGRVTQSEIVRRQGQRTYIEEPHVFFSYSVDGTEYVGHTMSVLEVDTSLKQDAEAKLRPYPVGQEVAVFYNPKDPKDSLLEKETSGTALLGWGLLGGVVLCIGILIGFGVINLAKS
jgi:hypothetical protein